MYSVPQREMFGIPPSLKDQLDEGKLIQKFLPRQKDVDKLLAEINKKVLRQTHLPGSLKDIQAAYLSSPQFRDVYIYLMKGKLPNNPKDINKTNMLNNQYMVLDGLLFKINMDKEGNYNPQLCIPTSKADMLLQYYHSSPIAGHPGVTKCYMTINKRFHCPDISKHIRAYITGCHVCQMFKMGKKINRPFQKRVNINTPALTKLSMDIKTMQTSESGFEHILILLCEVSNYMVAIPLKSASAVEVCQAILSGFVRYFGTPTHIVCDKDPAFMSTFCEYFFQQMGINIVTIGPTNHKSLLAEHGIKSLSNIIMKHLDGLGKNWDHYIDQAMLAYNTYASPNLDGLSPFELTMGRKAKIVPEMEVTPEAPVTGTFKGAKINLQKKLSYLRKHITKFRDIRSDLVNKDKEFHFFSAGQLVYMYFPAGALLQTGTRKIVCNFVGPLVIYRAISPNQFLLMSLDGLIYPHLIEETRIKPGVVRTTQGNVSTLADLKSVIRSGFKIKAQKIVVKRKSKPRVRWAKKVQVRRIPNRYTKHTT
jgi:hypothetical protein